MHFPNICMKWSGTSNQDLPDLSQGPLKANWKWNMISTSLTYNRKKLQRALKEEWTLVKIYQFFIEDLVEVLIWYSAHCEWFNWATLKLLQYPFPHNFFLNHTGKQENACLLFIYHNFYMNKPFQIGIADYMEGSIECSQHNSAWIVLRYTTLWILWSVSGLILGLHSANERHCYKETPSLIGWAQTCVV